MLLFAWFMSDEERTRACQGSDARCQSGCVADGSDFWPICTTQFTGSGTAGTRVRYLVKKQLGLRVDILQIWRLGGCIAQETGVEKKSWFDLSMDTLTPGALILLGNIWVL